jgi:hypothetical protein
MIYCEKPDRLLERLVLPEKVGSQGLLFAFTSHKNNHFITLSRHIKNDWAATNLAVLNVILMWHRSIKQHLDALTAIGA